MIIKLYNPRTDKVRIRVKGLHWPRFLRFPSFVHNLNWWMLGAILFCAFAWYGIFCIVMSAF